MEEPTKKLIFSESTSSFVKSEVIHYYEYQPAASLYSQGNDLRFEIMNVPDNPEE